MAILPLPEKIHESTGQGVKFRSFISRFGDGYSQRTPDGLNAKVVLLDVVWQGLTVAEFNIVTEALDTAGTWGVLSYSPPAQAEMKFTLVEDTGYSIEFVGLRFNISCQLEQVFDL